MFYFGGPFFVGVGGFLCCNIDGLIKFSFWFYFSAFEHMVPQVNYVAL